ncbi:MAG: hypothetical protein IIB94_14070 [Candidatus Marinimicrobia bacterium]|nr:hypothetical protein [Candidatus Neomarinimicrobiota bacterium]
MDMYKKKGFIWGLLATLAMTVVMLLGMISKLSPMPAPIPIALAKWAFGDLPKPALMGLGMIAHFLYGGIAGLVFTLVIKNRVNIWKGLGWGILLWLGMQLIFLPLLGWGVFGIVISPKIAVATLMLHLIYGITLSWGLGRQNKITSSSES